MESLEELELGVTDRALRLSVAADHRRVVLAMVAQARRTLHIHSRDLDPAVYDGAEMEEAFIRFALRNSNARIFVLVQNSSRAVTEGHALLRVAHKLSSRVAIKIPSDDHKDHGEAFFLADTAGYIRRPVAEHYSAEANFKAPFEARKLQQYFEQVWERADADPQLRRLFI